MSMEAAQDDLAGPSRAITGLLCGELTPSPATASAAPVIGANAPSKEKRSEVVIGTVTTSRDMARCAPCRGWEGVECRRGPNRPAGDNGGRGGAGRWKTRAPL